MNQIILSTNERDLYVEFWKPVSWAYKKMFPDVTVHLAFLTNRPEDDELVKEFREYGKVTLFKPDPTYPEFGQAKMIRFILASQQGNDICYIDDIDLFPLSKLFITNKVNRRPLGHLLCVGGEVYDNKGTYPISQHTAEGWLFKKLINPNDKTYSELLADWSRPGLYDYRESLTTPLDWDKDSYFSDERLLRRLIKENNIPKFEMRRGYDNFMESTVDRFDWKIDKEKLMNHGYLNAHGIRPYELHKEKYEPLFEYINTYYP